MLVKSNPVCGGGGVISRGRLGSGKAALLNFWETLSRTERVQALMFQVPKFFLTYLSDARNVISALSEIWGI